MADALTTTTIINPNETVLSAYGPKKEKLPPVHFRVTFGDREPEEIIANGEGYATKEEAVRAFMLDAIAKKFAAAVKLERDSKEADIEKASRTFTLTVKAKDTLTLSFSAAQAEAKKRGKDLPEAFRDAWEFSMQQAHPGKAITFTD